MPKPDRRPAVALGLLLAVLSQASALVGCEQQEFRMPPYVVREGCEFTLVISGQESASTTVAEGNTRVTYTLSAGRYRIDIADCNIVDNSFGLPVYDD